VATSGARACAAACCSRAGSQRHNLAAQHRQQGQIHQAHFVRPDVHDERTGTLARPLDHAVHRAGVGMAGALDQCLVLLCHQRVEQRWRQWQLLQVGAGGSMQPGQECLIGRRGGAQGK
jgi:hypothetical protein